MGVEYFPCDGCGEIICDAGYFWYCICRKMYCQDCFTEQMKKFPCPEELQDYWDKTNKNMLYRCNCCDEETQVNIIRAKIKKLKKELIKLEFSVLDEKKSRFCCQC